MDKNANSSEKASGFAELTFTATGQPTEKWEATRIVMNTRTFDGRSPTKNFYMTYAHSLEDGSYQISSDTGNPVIGIIEDQTTSVITGFAHVEVSGGQSVQAGTVSGLVTLTGIEYSVTGKFNGVI